MGEARTKANEARVASAPLGQTSAEVRNKALAGMAAALAVRRWPGKTNITALKP